MRSVLFLAPVAALALACGPATVAEGDGAGPGAGVASDGGTPLPEDPGCDRRLTPYLGDCVAPPAFDPAEAVVAHYGPRHYDDPDELARFVLPPGGEVTECAYSELPNDAHVFYNRYDVHTRPGEHHIILYAAASAVPDGTFGTCQARDEGARLLAVLQGGIEGSVYHYPPSGQIAPENAHLGTELAAHQTIAYEMHAVNPNDHPLLRESWTVFHLMPAGEVKETAGQIAFNGGFSMQIEPHTRQIITNSCTVPDSLGTVRLVDFFGHMHAHGERFSAWVAHPEVDGTVTRELIYESYDWSILDLIELNSVKQNPPVAYAGGTPGGWSGILTLGPGDRLDYECAMNNTEDYRLVFAGKAFSGEMCNLFGSYAPGITPTWTCLGH